MKDFLREIHQVDDSTLQEYISLWEEVSFPKKTRIISEGTIERYLYFVKEGVQKAYYMNDVKEHIIIFTYAPSFCGIPESFLTQTPSKSYLETITDSKLMRISYEKHQQFMLQNRQIETLFRKAIEALLIGIMQRYQELMAYDVETRFKTFTNRSPHLLNLISQKDLASYLRIDPTNFSKLMNKVSI